MKQNVHFFFFFNINLSNFKKLKSKNTWRMYFPLIKIIGIPRIKLCGNKLFFLILELQVTGKVEAIYLACLFERNISLLSTWNLKAFCMLKETLFYFKNELLVKKYNYFTEKIMFTCYLSGFVFSFSWKQFDTKHFLLVQNKCFFIFIFKFQNFLCF